MPCKYCGKRWVETDSDHCTDHGELFRAITRDEAIARAMLAEIEAKREPHPKGGSE